MKVIKIKPKKNTWHYIILSLIFFWGVLDLMFSLDYHLTLQMMIVV